MSSGQDMPFKDIFLDNCRWKVFFLKLFLDQGGDMWCSWQVLCKTVQLLNRSSTDVDRVFVFASVFLKLTVSFLVLLMLSSGLFIVLHSAGLLISFECELALSFEILLMMVDYRDIKSRYTDMVIYFQESRIKCQFHLLH